VITYFLPDPGIHGGVKVACQFVQLLRELGVRAVTALPNGIAPTWFACSAPVVDEAVALAALEPNDWAMITWPPHYATVSVTPARVVNHAQGVTDMDTIFADPHVMVLTCWNHAAEYVRARFGREPIEVGIAISDGFFLTGEVKIDNRVAFMPRRGRSIAEACITAVGDCEYLTIDGCSEAQVAQVLKSSGIFLATSVGEDFGLPALEAMAAGCVVVSVPVKGGVEYLDSGKNCLVAVPESLPETLFWISRPAQAEVRQRLRHAAVATAYRYRTAVQQRRLKALLQGPLRSLLN